MNYWRGAVFSCVLLLGGCASFSPSSEYSQDHPSAYRNTITIDGRLSVQYERNGANEALHGSFSWSQKPGHTTVTLSSPLGQTLAVIEVTPDMSILKAEGQPPRTAPDPDSLSELALGWPLPVSGMRDWLQGIATDANGKQFIASAESEKAEKVTTQNGWHIDYVSWQPSETTPVTIHPKRIDLARNTQQAGNVSIRLVIDNWQPH